MKIKQGLEGIKIEGYRGTWYALCKEIIKDMHGRQKTVYALEHEFYGDEVPPLFVDSNGKVLAELEGYCDIQDIKRDMEDNEWEE